MENQKENFSTAIHLKKRTELAVSGVTDIVSSDENAICLNTPDGLLYVEGDGLRIIKRRTVANNACDSAHVRVNGRDAKASYDVKIGDIIEVTFGEKTLRVKVTDIKEHTLKNDASSLFEGLEQ